MALIITLLVAFIVLIIWSANQKREEERAHEDYLKSKNNWETAHRQFVEEFGEGDDQLMEWRRKNYADNIEYSIAGINFRGLNNSHLGPFDGVVVLEEDNPHDPFAVAIYRGRKKVGYIPKRDSITVHDDISKNGGCSVCSGFIYTFLDENGRERFAGKVIIGAESGQIIPDNNEK